MMNVDLTLQQIRELHGFTRQQAANMLGVSYSTLYFWERGRNYPPIDAVVSMSELYSMSILEIISIILKKEPG